MKALLERSVIYRPICWLRSLFTSVSVGTHVSNHEWVETEKPFLAKVQVLQCEDCGAFDIGYYRVRGD